VTPGPRDLRDNESGGPQPARTPPAPAQRRCRRRDPTARAAPRTGHERDRVRFTGRSSSAAPSVGSGARAAASARGPRPRRRVWAGGLRRAPAVQMPRQTRPFRSSGIRCRRTRSRSAAPRTRCGHANDRDENVTNASGKGTTARLREPTPAPVSARTTEKPVQ
jgi:hypothetical protein